MARKKAKKRVKKGTGKRRIVKRRVVKKRPAAAKKTKIRAPSRAPSRKPKENIIGVVTHYFPKVQAAVVKLKAPLAVGDTVIIKAGAKNFTQKIDSMQIDRVPINSAKKGQEIGLQVKFSVKQGDLLVAPGI